jgi:hypothetical protein
MIELKQKTAVVSGGFDDSAWIAARKDELPLKENEPAICRACFLRRGVAATRCLVSTE